MSFTYSGLKTAIQNYAENTETTFVATLDTFIKTAEERILKATGEANRFSALLGEYEKSKEVTRQRLYLEAMEEVLPGVKKYVLDPENEGNLLQFLPLNESSSTTP